MNKIQALAAAVVATLAMSAPAQAQDTDCQHPGDHPAVIVKRQSMNPTYDYAAQFYAHPAGLALSSDMPHTMNDHPAVTIAKRASQPAAYDYAAQMYAHPAGLTLLAQAPREVESMTVAALGR